MLKYVEISVYYRQVCKTNIFELAKPQWAVWNTKPICATMFGEAGAAFSSADRPQAVEEGRVGGGPVLPTDDL